MAFLASSRAMSGTDDISRYIVDHIRVWSSSLDHISEGTHLRQGLPATALPRTPDLSFRNDTTIGHSSLKSQQQRTPVSRRCLTPKSNNLGAFRSVSRSPSPNSSMGIQDEYRRQNSTVVYYDGNAQQQLTTMHTEIKHAQNGVQKHRFNKMTLAPSSPLASEDRVLELLAQLSDNVEIAAFRLLQQGDAAKEFETATTIFRDLTQVLETDWTSCGTSLTPPASQTTPTKVELAVEPSVLGHHAVTADDLEADDSDDEEMMLPQIRLTSRMAAR